MESQLCVETDIDRVNIVVEIFREKLVDWLDSCVRATEEEHRQN